MINNTKSKILVGCLALLLALSVGYAFLSQNITINGTAKAKGDFSITTVCEKGLNSKIPVREHGTFDPPTEGGYENDSCTVNGKEVNFQANLKYPGAARLFTVKFTNTGTIDAYLDSSNGHELLENKYCIDKTKDGIIDESECETRGWDTDETDILGYDFVAGEKADGTVLSFVDAVDYDAASEYFFDETGSVILRTGDSLYLVAYVELNKYFGDDGTKSIFATQKIKAKFNFSQKIN